MGIWVEIVTLLVPGFNDGEDELRRLTAFLASVSPDLPWHVTAFHSDYRMADVRDTSAALLERAAAIGREAGLRYVYAGNRPGEVGRLEDTCCASCGHVLVRRTGFLVRDYTLTSDGRCPACQAPVPGRWDAAFVPQLTSRPWIPGSARLLRVY
jgi:pyruvate formate lyase activating enzyme